MTREEHLQQIALTIADYREGEVPKPSPEHVDRWVQQFDPLYQLSILEEMDHVLKRVYFSRKSTVNFLEKLLKAKKLVGDDPCAFWKDVKFLDIQLLGASQREMLVLFNEVLKEKCGLRLDRCGTEPREFVYLDDAVFSGGHIFKDIANWIACDAPADANLHVIVVALHLGSFHYRRKLRKAAKEKNISIQYWSLFRLEDRKTYTDTSDVLRPVLIPETREVQSYSENLTHTPVLRNRGKSGKLGVFLSESGRHHMEQEFLRAGVQICNTSRHLYDNLRPLGSTPLNTLGFGSLVVTFRNCANNTPLALWASHNWYPLFERKTNRETSEELNAEFGDE